MRYPSDNSSRYLSKHFFRSFIGNKLLSRLRHGAGNKQKKTKRSRKADYRGKNASYGSGFLEAALRPLTFAGASVNPPLEPIPRLLPKGRNRADWSRGFSKRQTGVSIQESWFMSRPMALGVKIFGPLGPAKYVHKLDVAV